jgi:divalent metal cation (Fe/Co/Zn/Cd) transporter
MLHPTDVEACQLAAPGGPEPLAAQIDERIAALLSSVAIAPTSVRCRIEPAGHGIAVHLDLPIAVTRGMAQALAVRVLDAVRSSGRTFGKVDVHVHPTAQGHHANRTYRRLP